MTQEPQGASVPFHAAPQEFIAGAGASGDAAWRDVLDAVDRTYADLVSHHEQLERQNHELEALRSFHASVLASVSDALVVVSRQGTVVECSASVTDLTGRGAAEIAGLPLADLFTASDIVRLDTALAEVAASGQPVTIEAALEARGQPAPLDLSVAPRFDERHRLAGWVLSGRPLGELRRANARLEASLAELKSAQTMLVRNEKLASLGRLLAGVAHELNNPISFVYANAHAMARYAGKLETYFERVQAGASRAELSALRGELRLERDMRNLREAVEGTSEGAARVRDIVEDLRRLSSDGSGEMVAFDLAEAVQIAAHWVLRGSRAHVALRLEGLPRLMVRGRPGHIQQVMMNLVQNAADAIAGAGTDTAPATDGAITVTLSAAEGMGRIEVADTGPGIPPAIAAEIFDPFFTTKEVGQGTGLGLSISAKIVEEHGSHLELIPGTPGARFRFELPLAQEEAR